MTTDEVLTPSDAVQSSRSELLSVAALMTTLIVGMLNVISLGPFLPTISSDLHVSVPVLGQISTVVLLLTAVIALVVGPLADHYGHRRFLVTGLVAIAIATLGTGLAPNFGTLLVAQLFSAVSAGMVEGICFAFAATLFVGEARRKVLGVLASAGAGAAVVGVPLLTTIASLATWRVAFFSLAILSGGALPLVLLSLPGASVRPSRLALSAMLASYSGLRGSRPTQILLSSSFVRSISWQGFPIYVGAFLAQRLGAGNQGIGAAYMVGGGAFVLASMTVGGGSVVDRYGRCTLPQQSSRLPRCCSSFCSSAVAGSCSRRAIC